MPGEALPRGEVVEAALSAQWIRRTRAGGDRELAEALIHLPVTVLIDPGPFSRHTMLMS